MSERARFALLPALGVSPSTAEVVAGVLDRALDDAAHRAAAEGRLVTVLDAGCGRMSALHPFRDRIGHLVGVDIHAPAPGAISHLDEFVVADLCVDGSAFESETFDLVLSSFTLEHFGAPLAALANLARAWGRTWPTYVAGLIGDVATRGMPPRRSTIVAVATKRVAEKPPGAADAADAGGGPAMAPVSPA